MDWKKDQAYYGKILTGHYSPPLKERVAKCISGNRAFEATGNPAICYIAAWHEKDRIIWYEFAGRQVIELWMEKRRRISIRHLLLPLFFCPSAWPSLLYSPVTMQ
jgi:hypothetical protein